MIDKDIIEFVDKFINSILSWELIVLFHSNPGIQDDNNGISKLVGRKPEDVKNVLQSMCNDEIVQITEIEGQTIYYYHPSEEIEILIKRFIESIKEYDTRILLLSRVMEKSDI